MEDVLDVYAEVPVENEPLICMDEASKQLLGDELSPIPMIRGIPFGRIIITSGTGHRRCSCSSIHTAAGDG